jgi:adenylate cyclase
MVAGPLGAGTGEPARPTDADDPHWVRLRRLLLASGATESEIEQARRDGVVDLLVADRLLVPGDRRYTASDVAEITGVPVEVIRRFWQALGLPVVAEDSRLFGDVDVEAVETFVELVRLGVADVDRAVQLARVFGMSMARIAEAELGATVSTLSTAATGDDSIDAAVRFAEVSDRSLPAVARLLEFVWRRHLQAATRRAMVHGGRRGVLTVDVTVGFADMVGFTSLSQQLDEAQLAAVVARFEAVAHDTVSSLGGRVVKMIGDEVMFVADAPGDAAAIGLQLAELYASDDLLSDVRVGLALGPVLVQDGDYYGPVVNLASRIVRIADPGTVLVSDELRAALFDGTTGVHPDAGDLAVEPLRPRVLKDVGRVVLWNLHRPGAEPSPADRRSGRRWQRWNEVLRDLEELRARGEQAIEEARRSGRLPGGHTTGPGAEDQPSTGST